MGFHLGGGNAQSRVGVGLSHVRRRMKDKTGEYLDVEIEMSMLNYWRFRSHRRIFGSGRRNLGRS